MTSLAGILLGPDLHHLDHLAPLCSLLKVPLIVSTEAQQILASTFYPDLTLEFLKSTESIVQRFERLITSVPRPLFEQTFFFAEHLLGKKIETIWCPHGNSDKGRLGPFMEGLQEEKTLFIYGSLMGEFLKEKKIFAQQIPVGNYRLTYYEKHCDFYEKLLPSLQKTTTLLWAPTWNDKEKSSSFPLALIPLLQNLPLNWQLLIKLHPHLYHQFESEITALKSQIKGFSNIQLIENFPPIYPLLKKVDLYIGDRSSIGYDFLAFDRPMLFFDHPHPSLPLLKCGPTLTPGSNPYPAIREELTHPKKHSFQRQALYAQTFEVKEGFKNWLLTGSESK